MIGGLGRPEAWDDVAKAEGDRLFELDMPGLDVGVRGRADGQFQGVGDEFPWHRFVAAGQSSRATAMEGVFSVVQRCLAWLFADGENGLAGQAAGLAATLKGGAALGQRIGGRDGDVQLCVVDVTGEPA